MTETAPANYVAAAEPAPVVTVEPRHREAAWRTVIGYQPFTTSSRKWVEHGGRPPAGHPAYDAQLADVALALAQFEAHGRATVR